MMQLLSKLKLQKTQGIRLQTRECTNEARDTSMSLSVHVDDIEIKVDHTQLPPLQGLHGYPLAYRNDMN